MKPNGSYRRRKPSRKAKTNAQDEMVRRARDNAVNAAPPSWQVLPLMQAQER
jgi:hypothetical protein